MTGPAAAGPVNRMPAFLADTVRGSRPLAITGCDLFVGDGRRLDGVTVLARDGLVEAIGTTADGSPDDAVVVDAAGMTLMPGIVDAHAHTTMLHKLARYPRPAHGAEPLREGVFDHFIVDNLRRALCFGVTTIRDTGTLGDGLLTARQAMRYGAFVGPRVLSCGKIVSPTSPGGRFFPGMYRDADGPDDMRRAVREQIRAGADYVKIMSTGARSVELENPLPAQMTTEEIEAFVDEAHRQGYRAAAHCEGIDGTEAAVLAGCDTIEHGFHLDERPDLLERMAENGQVLVPTLSFLHEVAESGSWTDELESQGVGNVTAAERTLRAAMEAGVTIAMGSDSMDTEDVHSEITWMIHHGMPVDDALVAATQSSSIALGIVSEVGTVDVGKRADLLLVVGDPVSDPTLLGDRDAIALVTRNGRPVEGTLLRTDLAPGDRPSA